MHDYQNLEKVPSCTLIPPCTFIQQVRVHEYICNDSRKYELRHFVEKKVNSFYVKMDILAHFFAFCMYPIMNSLTRPKLSIINVKMKIIQRLYTILYLLPVKLWLLKQTQNENCPAALRRRRFFCPNTLPARQDLYNSCSRTLSRKKWGKSRRR